MGIVNQTSAAPAVSVIVPARNAAGTLPRCLDAIVAQASVSRLAIEVVVVDDFSGDETAATAARYPVRLIRLDSHRGAAAARNRGAEVGRAPLLFFLDADVVLAPGALEHGVSSMADTAIGALIGSYDDDPAESSTVSRFKNLAHHYMHQQSGGRVTTFWGGCGLVRRDMFVSAGGFDNERFSLEDVEFGYRLSARGVRIDLDRALQVKHLKRWTFHSMLATDVGLRAVPWALMWLEGRRLPSGLNFSIEQRIAAIVALALPVAIAALALSSGWWPLVAALLAAAVWMNRGLYLLFLRRGGAWFAMKGFVLQQFYYLYSLFSVCAGLAIFMSRMLTRRFSAFMRRADAQ